MESEDKCSKIGFCPNRDECEGVNCPDFHSSKPKTSNDPLAGVAVNASTWADNPCYRPC